MCDDVGPTPVVLHCGSSMCRAGIAVEDNPRSVFPSLVGRPRAEPGVVGSSLKDTYVGDEARTERRGVFDTWSPHPLEGGLVKDWDGMEKIWHHIFYNELRVDPKDQPLLISEPPLNSKENREKTAEVEFIKSSDTLQVLFETFGVPSLCLKDRASLALASSGRVTGLVVLSGHTISHCVPLYEGYPLKDASKTVKFGGRDVTENLAKLLAERGHHFCSTKDMKVVNDIKEKHCLVDNPNQNKDISPSIFQLPDGSSITLEKELALAPEVLFKPELLDKGDVSEQSSSRHSPMGLGEAAWKASRLTRSPHFPDLHPWATMKKVVLAGGNTLLPGFDQRLAREATLKELDLVVCDPGPVQARSWGVFDNSEYRKEAVWIGGSIFASISTLKDISVSREDFLEKGSNVVNVEEERRETAWLAAVNEYRDKIKENSYRTDVRRRRHITPPSENRSAKYW